MLATRPDLIRRLTWSAPDTQNPTRLSGVRPISLLSLIQYTCNLLAIPAPVTVTGSTDTQVLQLYALANEEGHELARRQDWQALTFEHTFNTLATPEQPDAVPDDWDHFIANSFWDRTTVRPVLGPITPQQWQAIQAYPQINGVYLSFRERDNTFLMTPTPAAGDLIAYEYVSLDWAVGADTVRKPQFTSDTDTTVLPERIFELGLRWRFRKSKGLDYSEDFRTYEQEVQKLEARDGGNGMLDIAGRSLYDPYGFPNVQAGNFPGPGF